MLGSLPKISVPVEILHPFGIPLPNSLIISILNALIIFGVFALYASRRRLIPGPLQNFVEWVVQGLLNLCEEVAGKAKGRVFFPWVASIFLFVLLSNLWEVVPGIETLGSLEHGVHYETLFGTSFLLTGPESNAIIPWLRTPSSDLNFTLAIAVVSVIATQWYGFKMLGFRGQIGRYINLREGPMGLFVGVLEAILELARVVSFSFRLFGNLFAGGVLLLVMSFLLPVAGPIGFYFLELFVGFIQAFVFAMLTLIFMTLGTTGHGHADAEEEHAAEVAHQQHERAERALAPAGRGHA